MRFRVIAVLSALLVSSAAGCGGEDASESGPLVAAATRTANERSARFAFEMDVDTKKDGKFRAKGSGVGTDDSSRGRFTMDATIPGQGRVKMEMIVIRDEFWMRSSSLDLPAGKEWMHSVDRSVAPTTMTTRELLELIRESGEVEEVGAERVRGRPTVHYKATVSIDDLFENSPKETQDRFRKRFEALEGKDFELPIEVWIDDEDLVRRMDVSMDYEGQKVEFRQDMLEFGVDVPAAPPSAATVVEEDDVG